MGSIHLIRFPTREDRLRAIRAFYEVKEARVLLTEDVLGVTAEHIKALEQAIPPIPFEYISKPPINGQTATPVPS